MDDGKEAVAAPLPTLEPISRPSSTATTASEAIAQLPSIQALATGGSATSSPQSRPNNASVLAPGQGTTTAAMTTISSPHATVPAATGGLPVCQNCQTSTTPLWRRDEMGSVLCNACGLFLKLHGRPRPISLKTDVIKSRNRVKTVRPDMQMKKKQGLSASAVDPNGLNMHAHDAATAAALAAVRRTSQHKANGHDDSPVSRTGTPSMYDPNLPMYTNGIDGHQYQSPALPQYPLPAGGSPGHDAAVTNGEGHGDIPETREQLVAANSSLKTRVSELEVINELYRGRLTQLETDSQNADNFRHQAEEALKAEAHERQLREDVQRKQEDTQRQLDDSHRRENILKRRLDEMEQELKDAQDKMKQLEEADLDRPAKKPRIEEESKKEEPEAAAPTPQSTS